MKKEVKAEKKYVDIKGICKFKTFYIERTKSNLKVSENCNKCGKKFEDNDQVFVAITDKDEKEFICTKCSKE